MIIGLEWDIYVQTPYLGVHPRSVDSVIPIYFIQYMYIVSPIYYKGYRLVLATVLL